MAFSNLDGPGLSECALSAPGGSGSREKLFDRYPRPGHPAKKTPGIAEQPGVLSPACSAGRILRVELAKILVASKRVYGGSFGAFFHGVSVDAFTLRFFGNPRELF